MPATNPLIDKKRIQAGTASLLLTLAPEVGAYAVTITFPLESLRVYCSKWANPLRVALEAAEEALNALKCEIYTQELNEGKPYEKPTPIMEVGPAAKVEEP